MTHYNTTFIGSEPAWANACVGNNGCPGYLDYARGFSKAANLLIDAALSERGLKYSVDELVYPVCFNMRHSVELRLKGAISELIVIEKCRGRDLQFDLSGSHHIGNIWAFFAGKAREIDDRYEEIIRRLDNKIIDIAEVDATGQTFRYPVDVESQKHLVDVAIINFFVLKKSFKELEIVLDELHRLNRYLCDEYSWGTFTKKMSRKNLFELASLLPSRSSWVEDSFIATKKEMRIRFNISSRELSTSIKLIESHFEFSPKIDVPIALLGVEEVDIREFFCHWFKLNDVPSDKDPIDLSVVEWSPGRVFDELKERYEVEADIWTDVKKTLTPEKLAGIRSLFYFARDLDFSENYIRTYEIELEEAQVAFADYESSFRRNYLHVFRKTNAAYNILHSLYFLWKVDLADQIVTEYNLSDKLSWLDDARTRALFRKPDYCKYDT